ncbi:hypothetical protein N8E89_27905 (plasmid) [Phyllobacterium sp. A18/5-2]|uniref:hypothetical protein n=1 Tax=Phyllobacterium sp. A18/5-2 TaxID=2978392 RepID=UPI0021C60496|nr:hypothetical protein [Phyllobacterium sp. A18/5-2]UXN67373.1 hypothetical protein N8E89_27905 [Phyllobacterium sp. A18/5-2]
MREDDRAEHRGAVFGQTCPIAAAGGEPYADAKGTDDCRHRRAAASAGIRYTPSCPSPGRLGLRHRTIRLTRMTATLVLGAIAGWVMADDPVE